MQAGDPILSVDVTRIHTDRFVDGFGVFRVCRLIAQRKLLRIPALLIAAAFCWASAAFEPHCRDVATRHRPTYENRPTSRAPGAVSAYSRGRHSLRQPSAETGCLTRIGERLQRRHDDRSRRVDARWAPSSITLITERAPPSSSAGVCPSVDSLMLSQGCDQQYQGPDLACC